MNGSGENGYGKTVLLIVIVAHHYLLFLIAYHTLVLPPPHHTTTIYGTFSGTTQVSQCQKRTSGLYDARED